MLTWGSIVKCVKSVCMLLPLSGWAARVHVAVCFASALGCRPCLRISRELMVNIMRNVWRGWEGMYLLQKGEISCGVEKNINKRLKPSRCVCSCTIARLQEQDVLQDCFSLCLKGRGQTSIIPTVLEDTSVFLQECLRLYLICL